MKLVRILSAALACTLCALPSHAQDKGEWRAASTTAKSITGDIGISDYKLIINFSATTIAQIRTLKPAEATALFNADPNSEGTGNIYRLSIPAAKRFLHKNTLCGTEETQWAITWATGRTLHLAFFSGPAIPTMTPEALPDANNLCGTFTYVR